MDLGSWEPWLLTCFAVSVLLETRMLGLGDMSQIFGRLFPIEEVVTAINKVVLFHYKWLIIAGITSLD